MGRCGVGHAELFEVDEDEGASDTDKTYRSRESAENDHEWADLITQALTAALMAKAKLSRPSRKTANVSQVAPREAEPSDTSDREQTGIATLGRTMTATETRQRLTAAVMAAAYAQEQMRLLQDAQIIDDH